MLSTASRTAARRVATASASASASSNIHAYQHVIILQRGYASAAAASASAAAVQRRVGFIGLGNMGGHMARNLAKKGYSLVVFDVSPDAAQKLKQDVGADKVVVASSPEEVGSQLAKDGGAAVVTMLPSSPHVKEVYGKLFSGFKSSGKSVANDFLMIDSSTIDPIVAKEVAQEAGAKQLQMVDAPVSGGVGGAEAGTLTFMVGGSDSSFALAHPILSAMGKNIVHCGANGTGQVAKVCNNLVLGITMVGVSEAMNLGMSLGADPKTLAKIFNTSSARCWSSDTYNPVPGVMENVPASRDWKGGFAAQLMQKDLGLAVSASEKVGSPLPMGTQANAFYKDVMASGEGGRDFGYAFKYLQNHTKKQ